MRNWVEYRLDEMDEKSGVSNYSYFQENTPFLLEKIKEEISKNTDSHYSLSKRLVDLLAKIEDQVYDIKTVEPDEEIDAGYFHNSWIDYSVDFMEEMADNCLPGWSEDDQSYKIYIKWAYYSQSTRAMYFFVN